MPNHLLGITKLKRISETNNTPWDIVRADYKHPAITAMGCTKKKVAENSTTSSSIASPRYSFTQRTIMPLAVESFKSFLRPLSAGTCLLNQKTKASPSAVQL